MAQVGATATATSGGPSLRVERDVSGLRELAAIEATAIFFLFSFLFGLLTNYFRHLSTRYTKTTVGVRLIYSGMALRWVRPEAKRMTSYRAQQLTVAMILSLK